MITLYSKDLTVIWPTPSFVYSEPRGISYKAICELPDAISCIVTEELNGKYELVMTYYSTGTNADKIDASMILGVTVPLRSSMGINRFRIYRIEKTLSGLITVYARQMAWDLMYAPVINISGGGGSPSSSITTFSDYIQRAKYGLQDKVPFTFVSSLTYSAGYDMDFRSLASLRNYLGGEGLTDPDKTALQIFGGEYVFLNQQIALYNRRGVDRNISVHYGINLAGLAADSDLDDIYTGFIFVWVGDITNSSGTTSQAKIKSDQYNITNASAFPFQRINVVDYSGSLTYDTPPTSATVKSALNSAASTYRNRNSSPVIQSVDVDVAAVGIEEIYLGDTVHVEYNRQGIEINDNMKVESYEYDVLRQRYNKVTLGKKQMTLAKLIAKNAKLGG